MKMATDELGFPRGKIQTLDELEAVREAHRRFQTRVGALVVLFILPLMFLALLLPYSVDARGLPWILRTWWSPMGIFGVVGTLIALGVSRAPFVRQHFRREPTVRAVLAFDAAEAAFSKWMKTKRRVSLVEAREKILEGEATLDELPEFRGLQREIHLECSREGV